MAENVDLIVSAEAAAVVKDLNASASEALVSNSSTIARGVEVDAAVAYKQAMKSIVQRVEDDYRMLMGKVLADCGNSEESIRDLQELDETIAEMLKGVQSSLHASALGIPALQEKKRQW